MLNLYLHYDLEEIRISLWKLGKLLNSTLFRDMKHYLHFFLERRKFSRSNMSLRNLVLLYWSLYFRVVFSLFFYFTRFRVSFTTPFLFSSHFHKLDRPHLYLIISQSTYSFHYLRPRLWQTVASLVERTNVNLISASRFKIESRLTRHRSPLPFHWLIRH